MLAPASRNGDPTDTTRAFAYATFILSIPRVATEALTVFPGLGENARVMHAIKRWMTEDGFEYFFVAGLLGTEKTAVKFTIDTLCSPPFNLSPDMTHQVYTQVEAANTKVQAEWVAQLVKKHEIRSLTITATAFHLPRAYGTMLKALLRDVPWPVALIPDPAAVSPRYISPETGMSLMELTHGECPRILKYQGYGDVATLPELETYLDWLYGEYL
jgi:hypothetical protein